jgi:hypothetical protein
MKTALILALIVAVCMCSEINSSKENPEGNEENLLSNPQGPGNGQGGVSYDGMSDFSDGLKDFFTVPDTFIERSEEPDELEEETKGVVGKYDVAGDFLGRVKKFKTAMETNKDIMSKNPTSESDLLDTGHDLDAIVVMAEAMANKIPEEDFEKVGEATKLIDEMVENINKSVAMSFSCSRTVRELTKVRDILGQQLKEASGAKSKREGAECKTQVLDKELSAAVEEDDRLDSIAPEESSRL